MASSNDYSTKGSFQSQTFQPTRERNEMSLLLSDVSNVVENRTRVRCGEKIGVRGAEPDRGGVSRAEPERDGVTGAEEERVGVSGAEPEHGGFTGGRVGRRRLRSIEGAEKIKECMTHLQPRGDSTKGAGSDGN